MAFTAADIMRKASTILSDASATRWPLTELLDWINDATRAIAAAKPTATATTISVDLAEGTKQTLPSGYHQILRVLHNTVSGKAVTPAARSYIDIQIPNWHATSGLPFTTDVTHIINEPDDQGNFWVVPGNNGDGALTLIASAVPAKIARPSNPFDIEEYDDAVPVSDIYETAVLDYVLYRSFSKDMAIAGAANRAAAHYQQFANLLGIKTENEMKKTPDAPQTRFEN